MFLNKLKLIALRKDPVYECIMHDLIDMGALDEKLVTSYIERPISMVFRKNPVPATPTGVRSDEGYSVDE